VLARVLGVALLQIIVVVITIRDDRADARE
jgi:hypothetical protein